MSAEILDGRKLARVLETETAEDVRAFRARTGFPPKLIAVLVGDDPASSVYVGQKTKAAARVGIHAATERLPVETTEARLLECLREWNADPGAHGILVQMPLPMQISPTKTIQALDPRKDVDGFHPWNVGLSAIGSPALEPCTPTGVLELLARTGNAPSGKHVVIVGRSNIVGKPLMNMLVQKTERANATVTVCHTGTPDIGRFTRQGDIVIVASGRPNTVTGAMLREGCVVIDVGVNRVADPSSPNGRRLVGDVEFDSAKAVAAAITPVPGGVGPLTVALLMRNTLRAAQMQTIG